MLAHVVGSSFFFCLPHTTLWRQSTCADALHQSIEMYMPTLLLLSFERWQDELLGICYEKCHWFFLLHS